MARVDFTFTNLLIIGVMAATFIIVLKQLLRVVPTPAIFRQYVGTI